MQSLNNKSFIAIICLVSVGLLYILAPILTPFLVAALLAYLTNPLVERMIHWRIPRLLSVIIVFFVLFMSIVLFIFLLIPLIQKQIAMLTIVIPNMIAWVQKNIVPWLMTNFGIEEEINVGMIKATLAENWTKAGGIASWVFKTVMQSGFRLVEWVTNLLLIPVVTFYLLRDWNKVLKNARSMLPRQWEPTLVKLAKECDTVLSAFFRGQLLVMLALGIIYSVGLTTIGLQIGLIIGLIAGLVSIVPYLGFIVGIVIASLAAFLQFGSFTDVLLVWLVFAIGQILESTVLTPKLVGDRIGLHPVAVIFAVLTGGSLFGFFGVLLALPVAAVIMVWLRFLNSHYRGSRLYQ